MSSEDASGRNALLEQQPPPKSFWHRHFTVANFSTLVVVCIVAVTSGVILAITITSGENAVSNVVNEYILNIQSNVQVSFQNMFARSHSQMVTTATLFKYQFPICPHKNVSSAYPLSRDSVEIVWWREQFMNWIIESNYSLFGFGVGFQDGTYYDTTTDSGVLLDTLTLNPQDRPARGNITLSYDVLDPTKNFKYIGPREDVISKYDPRLRGWYKVTADGVVRWIGAYIIAVGPPPNPYTGHTTTLYDSEGTLCGVMLITWGVNDLNALLQKLSIGSDVLMMLLEPSGLVMASTWAKEDPFLVTELLGRQDYEQGVANPEENCEYSDVANGGIRMRVCRRWFSNYNYLTRQISKDVSNTFPDMQEKINVGSDSYFVMISTISQTSIQGVVLKVVTIYPSARVMGPVTRGRDVSIAVSVAIAVFCIIVSGLVTRIVLKPLNRIAEQMDELATVKFDDETENEMKDTKNAEGGDVAADTVEQPQSRKSRLYEVQKVQNSFEGMKNAVRSFSKYVPIEIVRQLMATGKNAVVGMAPCDCTVLFSDIVKFTSMCEKIDGVTLALLVKDYFTAMTTVVMSHGGIVDKFIGDAIMAVWGTPIRVDIRNFRACAAVCLMRHLNRQPALQDLFRNYGFELETRFGVHCGRCLSGNMGSQHRLSYTVIGDNVNLASRLEGLNKMFGSLALVTEDVRQDIKTEFVFRPFGAVRVVGRQTAVKVYELVGLNPDVSSSKLGIDDVDQVLQDCLVPPANNNNNASPKNNTADMTIAEAEDDVVALPAEYPQSGGLQRNHSLTTMTVTIRSNKLLTKQEMCDELLKGPGPVSAVTKQFVSHYEKAMDLYLDRKFSEAIGQFEAARGLREDDAMTIEMIGTCKSYLDTPPPATWNGEMEAKVK